jgi:lipopolysaccharide export system permease protein
MGQVLRNFLLALTAITIIFSLFVIMAEATRQGLAPQEIAGLIPFLVPGSLPYTVPVAMLFAVTIVYGRLGGDNEVMAIKAAGLSAWTVLWPALALASVLSLGMLKLSGEVIPRANDAFRAIILGNIEDNLYRFLKQSHEINNKNLPFYIQVADVKGKTLIDPVFKHRAPSPPNPENTFDLIVSASTAEIHMDLDSLMATVTLEDAESSSDTSMLIWVKGKRVLQYPIQAPGEQPRRVQQLTDGEILLKQAELRERLAKERKRQAALAALKIASGRLDQVSWVGIRAAYRDYDYWQKSLNELETEKQMRVALSSGVLFFVLLGAPMGILFAKRDFLSAFISCFVPILVIYYPLILAGLNLGKEGAAPAEVVFLGNAVLAVLCVPCLLPVIKH